MESFPITENVTNKISEKTDFKDEESASNFQKFIYDLFEKKGVLNNLRASLRGHIVEVLKSAQTGEPPTCQKHFTQRLELFYQAINILIAEYFLRLEFGYSLSVFVSEIPLANMVFQFAKNLKQDKDIENLKFNENDVWAVLNCLGLKCDSHCASNILEMYSKENLPLLACVLNCSSTYQPGISTGQGHMSSASLSSSVKSLDSVEGNIIVNNTKNKIYSSHDHCRHYESCKTCQAKMSRMRDKYRNSKKSHIVENNKSWNKTPYNVRMLLRNVEEVEQTLVDEMFQQLKDVYEAEVDMIRETEKKAIKRSLASHALQLHKRREEMEESFKAREVELERNVREKKQFLWGLARTLREQHAQMTRAMHAVQCETERLTAKEDSLKSQLLEAEELLKKRGEDMRKQISDELIILEGHLESMKKERDNINRERKELEQLKSDCETNSQVIKVHDLANDELRSHYDLLRDELGILKKYLETTKLEPKCVIERGTLTDMSNVVSKLNFVLNNEQNFDRSPLKSDTDARMRASNKVVNDLKKQKNVNFRPSNIDELYPENGCDRRSSASSEVGDVIARETARDRELLDRLREENERLKTFANQQREHIDELSSECIRLRSEAAAARVQRDIASPPHRPRTAPAHRTLSPPTFMHSLNSSASCNAVGWRKGAGEELSVFSEARPRILLPSDTIPFIGVLKDRTTNNTRHVINQWRSLRRANGMKAHAPRTVFKETDTLSYGSQLRTNYESPTRVSIEKEKVAEINNNFEYEPIGRARPNVQITDTYRPREMSPKSVLKEAKEKLIKYSRGQASTSRDKSPSSVLREAKTRLRKLEIEAEAVEQSYLDFRRRQEQMKNARDHAQNDLKLKDSIEKDVRMELESTKITTKESIEYDRYRTILNTLTNYKNKTLTNTRPIPLAYTKLESQLKESQNRHNYYLETPLAEFRKLYHSQRSPVSEKSLENKSSGEKEVVILQTTSEDKLPNNTEPRIRSARQPKNKQDELEILKDNITKIYNLNQSHNENGIIPIQETVDDDMENLDVIEAKENILEEESIISEGTKNNKDDEEAGRELLLVVESTVDTKEIDITDTESNHEKISTQMTIIVSPKLKELNDEIVDKKFEDERSISPEQAAKLTRNDALDAIFNADPEKVYSSVETELDVTKQPVVESNSDLERGVEDYPDDFSADVDNYNSRSDYEALSPISIPKYSEDDNFWDT